MTSNRYNLARSLLRPAIGPKKFENLVNLIKKPYSRWEIEFNCIFIHVPKVAGKAIAKSLLGAPNGTGHNKLKYYERDKARFASYVKVAFVRNPWDRLVSAFFYLKNLDEYSSGRKWSILPLVL